MSAVSDLKKSCNTCVPHNHCLQLHESSSILQQNTLMPI
jgi:hypothetical protein